MEIKIRVDVYQHDGAAPSKDEEKRASADVIKHLRDRMAEIQKLKNNRLVGENHQGLLAIRDLPAGDYGSYVKKTVEAENADRLFLMREEAKRRDVLVTEVQSEQWKARVKDAFKGEWVEIEANRPGTFRWVKKKSNDKV